MTEKQNKLLECVDARADELFAIGCDIFDHPEIGRQEFHAVETLTGYLENYTTYTPVVNSAASFTIKGAAETVGIIAVTPRV